MTAFTTSARRRALALLCVGGVSVGVLGTSGCGSGAPDIEVTSAVVPVPANPAEGAAYLTITNSGDADDELVGATSDVAPVVHLHETTIDGDGLATMDTSATLAVGAGSTVELRPGGLHLMLVSPEPLAEGDTVTLTLTFREAGVKTVRADVVTDLSEVFGS